MKIGDLIRLKRPFAPDPHASIHYPFAIVVELIYASSPAGSDETDIAEVLVYLCAGDRTSIYVDEFGVRPLYSFGINEIAEIVSSSNHPN